MTRKTRQRGHQWSDEFGVKGRYQRTSRSSELGNVCWMFCDVVGIPQCIGTSQNLRLIRFEDAVTNYGKEVDYAIERANKGKGKEE
ncbi:hypothetical protein CKAH01_16818 [Colletotrichum kahawae]|uniref:Uncharacterized protein n=1 Tax=Colletotrichum kahawae TaxID=34407 RepID=A0AAE0D804_COLKA|nr:hypothetical protein CKAH01_16818 [Colletotrichum kahawae]